MNRFGIIKEFFKFLRVQKRWVLVPILIFLVLLIFLLIFSNGSALAPFMYDLF
jgi:hypothetical protein